MKTTAKKRRKLLPAIAMLTVSAIMLSTATYAWFTMNKEASVTNIQLTASTPSSIEISLGSVSGDKVTLTDDSKWANTVDFTTIYKAIGALNPSSSATGQDDSYFAATNAVTAGTSDSFKAITPLADNEAAKSFTSTDVAKLKTGYYVDIPVWLRTRGTDNADLVLKATDSYVKLFGESGADISKAVRIAFISANALGSDTNMYNVWNTNKSNSYFAGKDAATGPITNADGTVNPTPSFLTEGTVANDAITNEAAATVVAKLPAGEAQAPGDAVQVTMRIWIEGQDTVCVNDNAGSKLEGSIHFFSKFSAPVETPGA